MRILHFELPSTQQPVFSLESSPSKRFSLLNSGNPPTFPLCTTEHFNRHHSRIPESTMDSIKMSVDDFFPTTASEGEMVSAPE